MKYVDFLLDEEYNDNNVLIEEALDWEDGVVGVKVG